MPTEDELEYDELTTEDALVVYKNQHVPPRYMHMIGDKISSGMKTHSL